MQHDIVYTNPETDRVIFFDRDDFQVIEADDLPIIVFTSTRDMPIVVDDEQWMEGDGYDLVEFVLDDLDVNYDQEDVRRMVKEGLPDRDDYVLLPFYFVAHGPAWRFYPAHPGTLWDTGLGGYLYTSKSMWERQGWGEWDPDHALEMLRRRVKFWDDLNTIGPMIVGVADADGDELLSIGGVVGVDSLIDMAQDLMTQFDLPRTGWESEDTWIDIDEDEESRRLRQLDEALGR